MRLKAEDEASVDSADHRDVGSDIACLGPVSGFAVADHPTVLG